MKKQLSKNWCLCSLDQLAIRISNGANVKQHEQSDLGFPITRIETIWNGDIDLTRIKYIVENEETFLEKYKLLPGDILFSHINSDSHLGKTALFNGQIPVLIHGTNLLLIRPSKHISSKFLNYQFNFLRVQGAFIDIAQRSVNQSSINQKKLKSLELDLPPLKEQNRIVAKIEELFSEIDNGLKNLLKAQVLLKAYREALLKNAFEGKLTEKWREKNPTTCPALQSQTIQKHELQKLPPIPSHWQYASLGQFIKNINAGKSFKCEEREPTPEEIGVAKVSALTWGEYNESESKTCKDPNKINPKYYINEGDFLFSRANTIDLVGACVIVKKTQKTIMLSDKTLRIKFNLFDPLYFLLYLRSTYGRNEIMNRSTGNQDSMRNIGQAQICNIIVPVCSIEEHLEIIKIVTEKLLFVENIEKSICHEIKRSRVLSQSILNQAFSGELVPQDTNDEPANVLLERIKAEKEPQNLKKKKSRQPQKVAV